MSEKHFYSDTVRNMVGAMIAAHPEKSYAKVLDNGDGTFNEERLKLFSGEPTNANEFFGDMINLIGRQLAYDAFREWKNPYDVFFRDASMYADVDQFITAALADTADDSASFGQASPASPFSGTLPTGLVRDYASTKWMRKISKRIAQDVWAGAFLEPAGLSSLVGILLKNMKDSINLFVYDQLTTEISSATNFPKSATLTTIAGTGDTDNARKAYEDILLLAEKMKLPSTNYNKAGIRTVAGPLHLFLNANYKASFDINVLASLFNTAGIDVNKMFTVHVVDMPASAAKQVGFICDDEAIVLGYRYIEASSIYNPATMEMNYWQHVAIKYGIRSGRDAVRLVVA